MDADERYCGTCKHGTLYDLCDVCEKEWEQKMIPDERFDERNSMDGTTSYQRLSDQAYDEAYDELVEHIQEDMALVEAQDYLIQIAVIWRGKGSTQEKYALIGDIYEWMITRNAENKMRGL